MSSSPCQVFSPPPPFPPDLVSLFQHDDTLQQQQHQADEQQANRPDGGRAQSPPLTHHHESLFETIAKLAGIESPPRENEDEEDDEGESRLIEEQEDRKVQGVEETEPSGERETIASSGTPPTLFQSFCSSSSSRRKSGNPTRISSEREKTNEGGGEVHGEETTGEDWDRQRRKRLQENGIGTSPAEEEEAEQEKRGRADGQSQDRAADELAGQSRREEPVPLGNPFCQTPAAFFPFIGLPPELEEHQRRLYLQLVQQQQNGQPAGAQSQLQQSQVAEIQRNFARLAKSLKDELAGVFAGAIDKVVGDFSSAEAQAHASRLLAVMSLASRQHQWAADQLGLFVPRAPVPLPMSGNRLPFPPPAGGLTPAAAAVNPFHALLAQHPLMAAMAAAVSQQHPGGGPMPSSAIAAHSQHSCASIFPPTATAGGFPSPRHFGPVQPQQPTVRHCDRDIGPRKKRAKVTDLVRGPRSSLHSRGDTANSSASERSTPQGFPPPTMVPLNSHHLVFRSPDRTQGGSPSGDDSERNSTAGDAVQPHTTNLTSGHLKKAKLMFFYQRYPSSSLLKSYFPDVHFTKNNTAQLVKWFSNFREFFYMQMEKFAKQSLAEGVKHAEEIVVGPDSEIFKQLNQHYNKGSAFQAPERLQMVVQETLREFFSALQLQKDTEPSWKKAIYKVIQQLDEPIPDYFRDPQFLEMLEQNP